MVGLFPWQDYKASGTWKSILSMKDEFYQCIWYKVHTAFRSGSGIMSGGGGGFCISEFLISILSIDILRRL